MRHVRSVAPRLLSSVCLLLLIAATAVAQQPPLAISVTDTAVDVTNVAPGGTILLIHCAKGTRQAHTVLQRDAVVLQDDDRDGKVRHLPADRVPLPSVWVAVDFASGAIAAGAHPLFPLIAQSLPERAIHKGSEDDLALLEQELRRVVVFLVRPEVGAWELFGRDGTVTDRDGAPDGRLKLAFADARTVTGREKAPKHLRKDDVVVAFDAGHLALFTARIAK